MKLYEIIANNSTDYLSIVDSNYVYLAVNNTYLELHQKKREDIIGKSVSEMLGTESFEKSIKIHFDKCLTGEVVKYGDWFELHHGKRFLNVSYTPIKLHTNQIDAVVVNFHDITEQKNLEEELIQSNATKNKLFGIISHDLRGPIGAILNLLDILNTDTQKISNKLLSEILPQLTTRVSNTYQMLDNLLSWSNTQIKGIKINRTNLNIDEICSQAVIYSKIKANEKEIRIIVNKEKHLHVYADKEILLIIIRNLLSNAIKFTEPRGEILLEAKKQNNYILFTVSDTGIGMTTEQQKQLLDNKFINSTRGTDNESGTGLGLKLVKEFVEIQGGKLFVESTLGEGTIFRFTVPVK